MAIKLILLLLATLLLIQTPYTESADLTADLAKDVANIFKEIEDRFEVLKMTLDELADLKVLVRENGRKVLKYTLEDRNILEVRNDIMKNFRKEIRLFMEKLEKVENDTKSNVFAFLEFEELVNKFKKEKVTNMTHEAEVVGNSLKNNELKELEDKVFDHLMKFVEKLDEQLDVYLSNLTPEEKNNEKLLLDWSNKLYDKYIWTND